MKKLSRWAKNHKRSSRIVIVVSFIALTALGIATGMLLTDVGVSISSAAMFVFICIYFAGLIAYPAKSLKGKKLSATAFYVRQKSCDWLLAASTFCMIVYLGNRPGEIFNYSSPLHAATTASSSFPKDSTINSYKTVTAFKASLKDENGKSLKWKEKKKLLKEQVRAIKKDKEMSDGAKVALIFLSVLVALGLLFLVATLACELSCNGSEGAAVLVTVGGAALVVFLLLLAIRAITGKKKKPKKGEPIPDDPAKTGKNE
jgi:hypothetical protein